jgi:hypothetical protein
MSIRSIIPKASHLSVIGGKFHAVFGTPTVGKYDFTNYSVSGTRQNVSVDLGIRMYPGYLYFFHTMNFSLTTDEGIYLESIDTDKKPIVIVKDSTTNKNIFHAPFQMFRYYENASVDSFHFNMNANSRIVADFQAILNQVASLVGVTDIFAQLSFMLYEITDPDFITEYKSANKKES